MLCSFFSKKKKRQDPPTSKKVTTHFIAVVSLEVNLQYLPGVPVANDQEKILRCPKLKYSRQKGGRERRRG